MIGRQRFSPMLRCCPGCPPAGPRIADLGPGFNFVGFKTEDRFSSGQLDWWFERAPQLMPANLHTHMVASRNSRLDLASQPPAPVPPPPPPPVRCAACCHWRRVLGAWQRPAVPMPHATAGAVLTLPPPPNALAVQAATSATPAGPTTPAPSPALPRASFRHTGTPRGAAAPTSAGAACSVGQPWLTRLGGCLSAISLVDYVMVTWKPSMCLSGDVFRNQGLFAAACVHAELVVDLCQCWK